MNKSNSTGTPQGPAHEESVSRRVADELHERIDQAAEKSEQFERKLHKSGARAQHKARELSGGLTRMAHENPWAVVGGSVALGILIGALASRR